MPLALTIPVELTYNKHPGLCLKDHEGVHLPGSHLQPMMGKSAKINTAASCPSCGVPLKCRLHLGFPSGIKLQLSSVVTCFVKDLVLAPSFPCLTSPVPSRCILGSPPRRTKVHVLVSGRTQLTVSQVFERFESIRDTLPGVQGHCSSHAESENGGGPWDCAGHSPWTIAVTLGSLSNGQHLLKKNRNGNIINCFLHVIG